MKALLVLFAVCIAGPLYAAPKPVLAIELSEVGGAAVGLRGVVTVVTDAAGNATHLDVDFTAGTDTPTNRERANKLDARLPITALKKRTIEFRDKAYGWIEAPDWNPAKGGTFKAVFTQPGDGKPMTVTLRLVKRGGQWVVEDPAKGVVRVASIEIDVKGQRVADKDIF